MPMTSTKGTTGWIAGSRPGLEVKDWGEGNWASALSRIALETKSALVFIVLKRRPHPSTEYGPGSPEAASTLT